MNKYERTPEHIADFHGLTLPEVYRALNELLFDRTYSHVRIIIGKGLHSKDAPVIGRYVKLYLLAKNIRYNQSKIQDGGEGAVEVFLDG